MLLDPSTLTAGEITAWGAAVAFVIGAFGAQTIAVIKAIKEVRTTRAHISNELQYARRRDYVLQETMGFVDKKADRAYEAGNHHQQQIAALHAEIADLNRRLVAQGALAQTATKLLPAVQKTAEETKAAVEIAAAETSETKQIAKDIHERMPDPKAE